MAPRPELQASPASHRLHDRCWGHFIKEGYLPVRAPAKLEINRPGPSPRGGAVGAHSAASASFRKLHLGIKPPRWCIAPRGFCDDAACRRKPEPSSQAVAMGVTVDPRNAACPHTSTCLHRMPGMQDQQHWRTVNASSPRASWCARRAGCCVRTSGVCGGITCATHATSHTESLWGCPAASGLLPGSPHSRLVRHLEGRAA